MTALYIIGGILLFIFIMLIIPLGFRIKYDGKATLWVQWLFIKIRLVPPKEKKKKTSPKRAEDKKPKPNDDDKKESDIKKLYKEFGISGLLDILKRAAELLKDTALKLKKHIVLKHLDINVTVVGNDAADTATKFGYVCAGVYPAVSFISTQIKLKKQSVNITPGFNEKETAINCDAVVKIKPLFLIGIAIGALFKAIKLMLSIKQKSEEKPDTQTERNDKNE